ncbi:hypothetical protein NUW58_g4685 [Xylaria curta]|uniref:Uncharacterized protein n=1 Tax=Xylaria curta TaxID=42375 RepID=A0ACC1P593_9PEZI|nr:hypothetical protein NUW58_g4685 [Xylaria curta]
MASREAPRTEVLAEQLGKKTLTVEQADAKTEDARSRIANIESECVKLSCSLLQGRRDSTLENQQLEDLLNQHYLLFSEYYKFFFASLYRTAPPWSKCLASRCRMPGRMWFLCVRLFLRVLGSRLPGSEEILSRFLERTYIHFTTLYNTVPRFRPAWVASLGMTARYRGELETRNSRGLAEAWFTVMRDWFWKLSDMACSVGPLHYHFAVGERRGALDQLLWPANLFSVHLSPMPTSSDGQLYSLRADVGSDSYGVFLPFPNFPYMHCLTNSRRNRVILKAKDNRTTYLDGAITFEHKGRLPLKSRRCAEMAFARFQQGRLGA